MKGEAKVAIFALSLILAAQFLPVAVASSSTPSGAARLVLSVTPPKLPSDGGTYSAVVVSLVDSTSLPTVASVDTTVYLTASPAGIVSLPDSVAIRAGRQYVIVNVTTTTVPGTATLTATSSGLYSALPAQLTTQGPAGFPSKLLVFVSPSQYLPRSDVGTVRVELVDDAGLPSKAIASVTALLSSSDTTVANLDQTSVTILPGNFYASGTFRTSANSGDAVITAAATTTGFTSGVALVKVLQGSACVGQCGPSKILLSLLLPQKPGVLPTDGRGYDALEVSLADSAGDPAVSLTNTVIQLTSSKSEVGSVPSLVTIPAGKISTISTITTSSLAGLAGITAFSAPGQSGLLGDNITVRTVIPAPAKLQVFVSPPSTTFASNSNAPFLVIQLQDSSGNPARARQDTTVIITSSNGSLVKSLITLTLHARDDYAYALIDTSGTGSSVLTAVSQGLVTSQAGLSVKPSPLVSALTWAGASREFIYNNASAFFTFTADFLGRPLDNLSVSWYASAGTMSPSSGLTNAGGAAYSTFSPSRTGTQNITASATSPLTGTFSVSYTLSVLQAPPKPSPTFLQLLVTYWYFIAAAVAAVVVALFYLLRLRRKKQRAEIEAGFEVV